MSASSSRSSSPSTSPSAPASASGTVVATWVPNAMQQRGKVRRLRLAWTSESDGSVSVATTEMPKVGRLVGTLQRVVFDPGAGIVQPSNSYDVTLTDAYGIDVLAGRGANLSNSTVTDVCPGVEVTDGTTTSVEPFVLADVLTLNVTNAGDTKQGDVFLYLV